MTGITTNPNDPDLGHGSDTAPAPQNKKYLVLSPEELAKGFVRPFRDRYQHIGEQPAHPLRNLTDEEKARYEPFAYVKFEKYPDDGSSITGRFWTQAQLDNKACGSVTTMGYELSATYARDPRFYGSTYCCACRMHRPIGEFVWDGTNERVGS